MKICKHLVTGALIGGAATVAAPAFANDLTANVSVTNNYIWRGLTQTTNDAAVSGGVDYAHDSGFYAGTWVSNVNFGADDVYSYEHDLYAGFSGGSGDFSWDVGYLYYNYDDAAEFDFGEVYGSIGFGGLSLTLNVLSNTEADEGPGQDFGFGEAYYASVDYGFTLNNGIEVGLHVGYHDGDFMEAFNGADDSYYDYNISIAKNGFGFMISKSDVDGPAAGGPFDSDATKFVVSYTVDFDLLAD